MWRQRPVVTLLECFHLNLKKACAESKKKKKRKQYFLEGGGANLHVTLCKTLTYKNSPWGPCARCRAGGCDWRSPGSDWCSGWGRQTWMRHTRQSNLDELFSHRKGREIRHWKSSPNVLIPRDDYVISLACWKPYEGAPKESTYIIYYSHTLFKSPESFGSKMKWVL